MAVVKKFYKFLASGTINTGLTYLAYLGLLNFLSYTMAYTIAYISGIVLSYFINCKFVFNVHFNWTNCFSYFAIWLFLYGLSVLLLAFGVEKMNISASIAPLVVMVIMSPVNFFLLNIGLRSNTH